MSFESLKATLDRYVGIHYPGIDMCVHHKGKEIFCYQAGYSNHETKTPVAQMHFTTYFPAQSPVPVRLLYSFLKKDITDLLTRFMNIFPNIRM